MAEFQTMPNSCELRDQLGRDWAIQVKPVGAAASEYTYLKGITSLQVNIETTDTDSTTIDMQGWTGTTKISRALTIVAEGKFVAIDGQPILERSQELLKVSGEELGAAGTIDVRVWRTDVDEGWEVTATNAFSTAGGNELRTFTSTLKSNCAPVRIHSVATGSGQEESERIDMDAYLKVLEPRGAGSEDHSVVPELGPSAGIGSEPDTDSEPEEDSEPSSTFPEPGPSEGIGDPSEGTDESSEGTDEPSGDGAV